MSKPSQTINLIQKKQTHFMDIFVWQFYLPQGYLAKWIAKKIYTKKITSNYTYINCLNAIQNFADYSNIYRKRTSFHNQSSILPDINRKTPKILPTCSISFALSFTHDIKTNPNITRQRRQKIRWREVKKADVRLWS